MVDDDIPGVLNAVGPRLRALRRQRGATLAQLSEVTGISLSTLSRLESGQRKPTLELLLPLAKAHGVQLDELVGAPATGDPRVHPRPFTRDGQTFVPLTRHLGGLHAYKQILPAKKVTGTRPELRTHEGYEWLYVLSGRLRGWLSASTISFSPPGRPPNSTPTSRTASPMPARIPSSSSASSGHRASGCTSAPRHRRRTPARPDPLRGQPRPIRNCLGRHGS